MLSKHITSLISPLAGQTTFVMNSQCFVEYMQQTQLRPTEVMVSFDIKSLFTNVPVDWRGTGGYPSWTL